MEKAEAFWPIAAIACGFIARALLARLANAAEFALIAENTRGSALNAFIAAWLLARLWKALALLAKRALFAADDAKLAKAAESLAKRANELAFAKIAAIAAGCDASAAKACE